MTVIILYVLLWLWDNRTFDSITKTNQRKIGAETAYHNRQYAEAARLYGQITYGSLFSDPSARLNLAHSYFNLRNYKQAFKHYQLLEKSDNSAIASVANSQAALIKVMEKDTASALEDLKTAIILEPNNSIARNNYIILKKHFSGVERPSDHSAATRRTESEKHTAGKSSENPQPPQEGREIAEGEQKEELLASLQAMNMSEEQAKAILDAMKSNESQYIYQLRRKQYYRKDRRSEVVEW
ncbi:tetratricopeptide repeat protein [Dyadobacter sandarakinus]|uniref:Tetratricopeptide repeat protein n=1 Tax=Dyadobacter sandarakinus TaxID=2747268 RepID=A0ABX7I6J5_9BACT|nr:hypothetical protein [Dyadobacter sandarakinus]QRR01162.1 hypothetical protein HWI92_09715 [Dyadobacter sandarakinus]